MGNSLALAVTNDSGITGWLTGGGAIGVGFETGGISDLKTGATGASFVGIGGGTVVFVSASALRGGNVADMKPAIFSSVVLGLAAVESFSFASSR